MKTLINICILTIISIVSYAQIETKYYLEKDLFPYPVTTIEELQEKSFSTFYVPNKEDESKSSIVLKYGNVIPVNINIESDGEWSENGKTWKLLIVSPKAKTIDFVFDKLVLPANSEVNVFDIKRRMIFGPIKNTNIIEGFPVPTDIFPGDSIIIQLDLEENIYKEEVVLSIDKIIHGYKDIFKIENLLKSAGACQVDVECSAGEGWESETEGTARIYGNGTAGTCALINNTNQDYTPYILTAKHVIDSIGTSNASIRFNYKATSCGGSTAANGITVSSLSLRASNPYCDMALLESSQDLSNQTSITFLGWNKNSNPNSVVSTHHPDAGFMKISKASSSVTTNNPNWIIVRNWDVGSMEPGSSGAPLFDQNKKIVAVQSLINSVDSICLPELKSYHGKLSYFWSSISSFLDPCNTGATQINSIKVNSILGSISGPSSACEGGTTFSFNHLLGDAPVTWNLSPTSLFSAPTSGSGSNPTIYANSNSNSGSAQINFNVGCDSFSKTVWVGDPDPDDFYIVGLDNYGSPIGSGNSFEVCENNYYTFYLYPVYNLPETHHRYGITDTEFYFDFDYDIVSEGYGWAYIYVNSINGSSYGLVDVDACTYESEFMVYNVEEGYCGYSLTFSPNPTSGETTLSIESVSGEFDFDETVEWEYEVYSPAQSLKEKKTKLKGNTANIQTRGWEEGIYIVRVKYKDKMVTGKLVVKK